MEPMKDSGYSFIGEIPKSWAVARLNSHAELYGRIGWQGLTSNEYTDEGAWLVTGTDFNKGKVDWDTCVHVPEKRWREAYQIQLENGDVLITKDGTVGKLAIVEDLPGHASLNSGVMRIVPKHNSYSPKYLYYVLQSEVFKEWFKDINAGASTIQHLFQGDFKHFIFPLPLEDEQKLIAKHLDKEIGNLDTQAEILEQQIDTLERYKSSLIHEAVTKGLDAGAPLKPSGVEWIGNIPSKWNITKVKYLATGKNKLFIDGDWIESSDISEGGIRYLTTGNVGVGFYKEQGDGYVTEQTFRRLGCLEVHPGDVLISRLNVPIGRACLAPYAHNRYVVAVDIVVLRGESFDSRYIVYAMNSDSYSRELTNRGRGATMQRVSRTLLGNMEIWLPSLDEQQAIADYLDEHCSKIDAILTIKREQVELLKKRRQSLIYEYVTGKRRVPQGA